MEDLKYVIGADDLGQLLVRTWVNASYAVHPDMRSHTGDAISFGHDTAAGIAVYKSTKHKLHTTKGLTEADFIGASDFLPNTI